MRYISLIAGASLALACTVNMDIGPGWVPPRSTDGVETGSETSGSTGMPNDSASSIAGGSGDGESGPVGSTGDGTCSWQAVGNCICDGDVATSDDCGHCEQIEDQCFCGPNGVSSPLGWCDGCALIDDTCMCGDEPSPISWCTGDAVVDCFIHPKFDVCVCDGSPAGPEACGPCVVVGTTCYCSAGVAPFGWCM